MNNPLIFWRRVGAGMALLATAGVVGVSLPMQTAGAENKLEAHRRSVQTGDVEKIELTGEILRAADENTLVISLTGGDLARGKIHSADLIDIHSEGQTIKARVLTKESYAVLRRDAASRQSLASDAAALCLVDGAGQDRALEVIGLGGGLATWLKAKPGTKIVLEKTHYRTSN